MKNAITLLVSGIEQMTKMELQKLFVAQKWGYVSNLEISGNKAYINFVNWENKLPTDKDDLSLLYKDKKLNIEILEWAPRRKWSDEQFSHLTSLIGR